MLNKSSLTKLFNLDPPAGALALTVYTQEFSPRLTYVCEFIFKHVLKINYELLDEKIAFGSKKGFKINYSESAIPGTFQILPSGLLSQTRISEIKPEAIFKNDCLYFYESKNSSKDEEQSLDFDIFSAVFFMISRYEEWQSFQPDKHGRFETDQSILFKHNFHLKPIVEIWIQELKTKLQKLNPDFIFPETQFQSISTIDVDNLYAFKAKGLLRSIGASVKDFFKGNLLNISYRINVLSNKLKDPFDIYDSVSSFCKEHNIPLIYFFLFRSGDKFNRTVDPGSGAFQKSFQEIKQHGAHIGLHPSYDAAYNKTLLQEEVNDLAKQNAEAVLLSRQHYLRWNIRSTPKDLLNAGIIADFTMGYASQAGFRAGTSIPFYYYDFDSETKTNLLFVPFCVMDGVYTIYKNTGPDEAYKHMRQLISELKKVNGLFISVFHERSFSDHLYPGFGTLYKKLHAHLNEV